MKKIVDGLIVAESLLQASLTAQFDWHWRRVKDDLFETSDQKVVRYVGDRNIYGWGGGMPLYLGHGWEKRSDARHIREMIRVGRFVEVTV
jgi:hypothetical protein